jgi:hypothetical protein
LPIVGHKCRPPVHEFQAQKVGKICKWSLGLFVAKWYRRKGDIYRCLEDRKMEASRRDDNDGWMGCKRSEEWGINHIGLDNGDQ